MPDAVGFSQVAERLKKHKINGLLIVGGFEVSYTLNFAVSAYIYYALSRNNNFSRSSSNNISLSFAFSSFLLV